MGCHRFEWLGQFAGVVPAVSARIAAVIPDAANSDHMMLSRWRADGDEHMHQHERGENAGNCDADE